MDETPLSTKTATSDPPGHDIFCTPENSSFVHQTPYEPLNTAERDIRLLKVFPDSGLGIVKCDLLPSVKLADVENKYLALSYCAGSAKNTRYISVNGTCCNAFANLHHALMEARHYWEAHNGQQEFLLWVDQICINQYDLDERSHQVSFMRDIYEKAKETLVCLSTPETSEGGMKQLIKLREALEREDWDNSLSKFNLLLINNIEIKDEVYKSWASFIELRMSPWWNRAWVFQEFMASEQTTFLHGRSSMPYSSFMSLFRTFNGGWIVPGRDSNGLHYEVKLSKDERESTFGAWSLLVAKANLSRTTDLKILLTLTQDSQATDPRDKLYSILGLVHPGYAIVPDYSTNTDLHTLLEETTKRIILFDDSLEVFSYQNRQSLLSSNTGGLLPSWVLNWTNSTSLRQIHGYEGHLEDVSIAKLDYDPHAIMQTSPEADFLRILHPQDLKAQISVISLWVVFLDNGFGRIGSGQHHEGSRKYVIKVGTGEQVKSDCELWILRGSREPFLLRKYYHGYRLVSPVICSNLDQNLECVPGAINNDGEIDMSKLKETRITIF
ncbi:hypothetical protein FVEN_g197 [Fusarium venenatum]|uniref:Heterokaryon incompatibility domain-containing protein n=1 Tax=Fusarium venenatum TaxID=56646 RepID=A0A2L2SYW3_9HYPO|nr:uncharacterized protein FVRRES_07700 [Fusarium venenatum]KAG8362385.1 hypothetical protein FVEN_g197 [Fusarium venenatum]KAH6994598.1 heterokaryon incompatibility protein-domain-containing protein [Fusarium venenatum]CEI63264.1 unnamed protein product [Fusarium venenatum]